MNFKALESFVVDDVSFRLSIGLQSFAILVEDGGVLRVGVIDSSDSVSPSSFNGSLSSSHQNMVLLKLLVIIKSSSNVLNFISFSLRIA